MFFPLWCATACYERFLALHVILIVPGTAGDFFVVRRNEGVAPMPV